MNRIFVALVAGILFGAGLSISQMTDPNKVLAFLDITGNWDPSLALVMGSALIVSGLATILRKGMPKPVLATRFQIPPVSSIDKTLIVGNILFGIGWGLIGLCPGPVIASLADASSELLYFFVSMLVGMFAAGRVVK